eukprot:TRINITY_DN11542_c0_g1_i2.p1 TRINITY_DN11542_c0_g1~~TRINITY_DN11542_c0_g1_i2.p1  ORF type:complete len:167 (+),score=32.59 TRINITY_DN11542_c0_g1_i2:29-529(+)
MPLSGSRFAATVFAEGGPADDDGSLWGMTGGDLFRKLHPRMQKFMKDVPGLRRSWEERMDSYFSDTSKSRSAQEVASLKEELEAKVADVNKEVEKDPEALDEWEDDLMGRTFVHNSVQSCNQRQTKARGPTQPPAISSCPCFLPSLAVGYSKCHRRPPKSCQVDFL